MPILDFWGPYAKLCVRVCVGGGGGAERMDEMHLSVFHSVSNRTHGRHTEATFFFSSLCQETDFYVERVTAHHIKRNDHSCFHNRLPNSKMKLKLKHL